MAQQPLTSAALNVDYEREVEKIGQFLQRFEVANSGRSAAEDVWMEEHEREHARKLKYMEQLQAISDRKQNAITISLDDVSEFENEADELVKNIKHNTRRYLDLFCRAIDAAMPAPTADVSWEDDVIDVIISQRRFRDEAMADTPTAPPPFPPSLTRRYTVYFKPRASAKPLSVRKIRSSCIGQLVTVRGIVTRVSDVKPLMEVCAYSCDRCGCEIFKEITQKQFTPLFECPSQDCTKNNSKGQLYMQTRASKFLKFQEVKLQELTDQVPVGHIPRTMTIHLYESLVRAVNPGDVVDISGIFLPTPFTGYKALQAGLLADTFLHGQHIVKQKKQYGDMELSPDALARVLDLAEDPDLYTKMSQSIAPEIYGHEDVKKALLLLLVGGATKHVSDGMKIRGDLNVCLMGDPGVAKSQLLKYISKVAPRGVYTTGRGSSGVGLTAAVMRDPVTDEMVLEGGALVLADNGVCCIDEFDKMDEMDRTAIHEVMEQQTISISKAGITTTLNARTSILAAANPAYGRYNPRHSPTENINLPAALLSRFDLLFLILDKPDMEDDIRLAQHVTYVHMHSKHPPLQFECLDATAIRHYISEARKKRPTLSREVGNYITQAYVKLRHKDHELQQFTYTSPRTLLGALRLSQALARLRLSESIEIGDVDEALRLMEASKSSLMRRADDGGAGHTHDRTPTSAIYQIIRDYAQTASPNGGFQASNRYSAIRDRVLAKGFTEEQLSECIREYEEINIWMLNPARTTLTFVTGGEQ